MVESGTILSSVLHLEQNYSTLVCAAHGVQGRVTSQPVLVPAQPPPPRRKGMCCDCCLGGTSVISALQAPALAGHQSHPDFQLVPPSARGSLQPTGPAVATCEATCWGAGDHP